MLNRYWQKWISSEKDAKQVLSDSSHISYEIMSLGSMPDWNSSGLIMAIISRAGIREPIGESSGLFSFFSFFKGTEWRVVLDATHSIGDEAKSNSVKAIISANEEICFIRYSVWFPKNY